MNFRRNGLGFRFEIYRFNMCFGWFRGENLRLIELTMLNFNDATLKKCDFFTVISISILKFTIIQINIDI